MSHITLPRAVVEHLFSLLLDKIDGVYHASADDEAAFAALVAALAEPELTVKDSLTVDHIRSMWLDSWKACPNVPTPVLAEHFARQIERAHGIGLAKPTGKDSLQVDAERYRWLRNEMQGPRTPLARVVWKLNNIRDSGDWTNLTDGQTLDEHIDAALAEPEKERAETGIPARSGVEGKIDTLTGEAYRTTEPDAKPKPATEEQIIHSWPTELPYLSAHNAFYKGFRAAERFHGITKEDK